MGDIRVSAASICRIVVQGKFLLYRNPMVRNQLTSFGGGIRFFEPARPKLEFLGARFEQGNDLRLVVDSYAIGEFERWFFLRQDREVDPYRELFEETVLEGKILDSLSATDVGTSLLWGVKLRIAPPTWAGHHGLQTQRYLEVFDTRFSSLVVAQLLNRVGNSLLLVSADEIRAGITNDGMAQIKDNCLFLLGNK